MRVKVMVVGITPETWFRGTKDERQVNLLNCLDVERHVGQAVKDTFDYNPTEEERKQIDLDKLLMQPILIGVSGFKISNARLKVNGAIDVGSVPSAAIIKPEAKTLPGKTP